MAFQGSLKELPLPDIIQLVSVSGKTGKFTLSRDHDRGYIYLKNGQMVHATVSDLVGEEAIYALAIWNQGEFQFNPNEEPDRQTITKSNTNLLMEAARRLDEWRVLSKKVPSIDYVPELQVRESRHEQITLNPQEWLLITRIDGQKSIADIGKALNISSFEVAKVLYGMITGELVALKKKSEFRWLRPPPRHRSSFLFVRHSLGHRDVVHRLSAGRSLLSQRPRNRALPANASRDRGQLWHRTRPE